MKNTKEHIIQKSLSLFLRESYSQVTMREILEKTGLSKGAFYHHFSGKEELFKEIVIEFFTIGAINYSMYPKDNLAKFIECYIHNTEVSFAKMDEMLGEGEQTEASFNFFFLMFEAMNRFPQFLEMERKQYEWDRSEWEKVIAQAKQSGEIKSETSDTDIADLFLYCTDGVFIRILNNNNTELYKDKLNRAFLAIYNNLVS